jgi:plastocyanin
MSYYNFSLFATGFVLIWLVLFTYILNASQGQSNMTSSISNPMSEGGIASDIYQNKMMTFGGNVKKIILLLPNEGHESPTLPQEQRLINQPYVPANIIIGPNTQIAWINGDVGHTHSVTILDNDTKQVFSSGKFGFNSLTSSLVLNNSGKFTYSESNVNKDDPKFVMDGTIIVQEKLSNANQLPETVGFLMVPAKDLDKHVSELTSKGIEVLDKYTFKDLRGGQKGTGMQQSLLLLGSKNGQDELVSALESITPTLPYS